MATVTPVARWSDLKAIERSGAHYLEAVKREGEDSDTYRFGRAVHAAVLQGIPVPRIAGERRSKADPTDALNARDYPLALAAVEAVRRNPLAEDLIYRCVCREFERSNTLMGMQCAGRIDGWGPELIVELKTTRDASARAFERDINRYDYGAQLAWYDAILGGPPRERYIIAVESQGGYQGCAVFHLSRERYQYDEMRWQRLLELARQCHDAGSWPGYPEHAQVIGLPSWANLPVEEEEETDE